MNNTTNNANVLPQIKTPKVFIPIILLIFVLVISIFFIIYKVKIFNEEIVKNIFIILFIVLLIFSFCIGLLPNFKDIKTIFYDNFYYFIIDSKNNNASNNFFI